MIHIEAKFDNNVRESDRRVGAWRTRTLLPFSSLQTADRSTVELLQTVEPHLNSSDVEGNLRQIHDEELRKGVDRIKLPRAGIRKHGTEHE